MKKHPSCAILLTFLKDKKRVGDFYYFILGYHDSFQQLNYNRLISASDNINKEYFCQTHDMEKRIESLFISMIGDMCNGGLKSKTGEDLLYHLYLDWMNYIKNNWTKIYSNYKLLMEKEYGTKKAI